MGIFDSNPTGQSEIGRGMDVLRNANRYAHRMSKPGTGIMQDYLAPAFGQAYQAAQGMDSIAAMRGGYEAMRQRAVANQGRYGMLGSGAAFAQNQAMDRGYAEDSLRAALQARMAKYQAMSGLASSASNIGMNAANLRQRAQMALAGAHFNLGGQQQQQYAADQAAWGQAIGTGVNMAMMAGGNPMPMMNQFLQGGQNPNADTTQGSYGYSSFFGGK